MEGIDTRARFAAKLELGRNQFVNVLVLR